MEHPSLAQVCLVICMGEPLGVGELTCTHTHKHPHLQTHGCILSWVLYMGAWVCTHCRYTLGLVQDLFKCTKYKQYVYYTHIYCITLLSSCLHHHRHHQDTVAVAIGIVLSSCCGTSHACPIIVVVAWWQWPRCCCLMVASHACPIIDVTAWL